MRSSTSGSDAGARWSTAPPATRRAVVQLLIGCSVVALTVEAAARFGLDRASKIQRHMVEEYRHARTIGVDGISSRGHVLFVGNSLLDEGVDFERLRQNLPGWDARRLIVEQTYYYDWYYGLKRLFREGARPDVIVLMLSVGQWMPAATRGDYSAYYLFGTADLPDVAHDLHMHPTQATGLFLAGISKFWAARSELRTFVIRYTMPGVGQLMSSIGPVNRRPMVDGEVEQVVLDRVERLKSLVHAYGAHLVVLVPPMLESNDGAAGLMRAAERAQVPALRPVASGTFGPQLYRDG